MLWLSNETPDVSGQGGQRRQYFQIRELGRAGVAVDAITLAGPQDDTSLRAIADVRRVHRHRGFGIPDPVGRSTIARAVRNTAYDGVVVAHLDSWAMVERAPSHGGARILMDLHNVLSAWADREGHHVRAVEFGRIERAVLGRVDAVAVCSDAEELRLGTGGTARRIVLPHGIDAAEWPEPGNRMGPPAVGAIGNWDWEPNRHGIEWFIRTVWPAVVGRVPDAEFIVAGAGLRAALADAPGVRYLGRIERREDLIARVDAIVVPVLDGVGAPVKYGEALASGRAVLATPDGASAHPGAPAFVSSDPGQWSEALVAWFSDRAAAAAAGAESRRYALTELTWSRTTRALVTWVRESPGMS
ncbi:glycosyltransferase family 4 protein [Agromyces ramosus]|uniref:glycosyltransferase family 4 protein n=1 Tax=Agromyces ramosus TaxID=33879 RepID=UPI0013EE692B|nr:glycosyltransferase family 4 protein [Agromyces ramosus]